MLILKTNRLIKTIISAFAAIIPWQIYVGIIGNVELPISFFILCYGFGFTILFAMASPNRALFKRQGPVPGYTLMVIAIATASFFRSSDNLLEVINVLGRLSTGLIILLWFGLLINSKSNIPSIWKDHVCRILLISAIPLGIIGLLLLVRPEMEESWVIKVSGILIESDSAATRANIQGIDKIGIVFMNTNQGAVFWGILMWLAIWKRSRSIGIHHITYSVFAIIFCVNVIGAGSRAGLLALVCTTMFFLIIHKSINLRYLQIKKKTVLSIILIITILFSIVLMEFYEVKQPVFIGTLERTQDQLKDLRFFGRFKLWAQSFNKSLEAPILGYGVKKMSYFNFPGDAPPHNFLLQIWLYGGIIAVLGFIWMIGSVFIKLFRRLKHSQDMWLPIVILFWVLIQSMFTNLIFADFRIAMILWLVISLFLWLPSANGNIRINLPIPGKGELA